MIRGARQPQSNGTIERLHRTLLGEHFRVDGRKTWFETIKEMQAMLDAYPVGYNTQRPHQGLRHERTDARQDIPGRYPQGQPEGRNHYLNDRGLIHEPEAAICQPITISLCTTRKPSTGGPILGCPCRTISPVDANTHRLLSLVRNGTVRRCQRRVSGNATSKTETRSQRARPLMAIWLGETHSD